MPQMTPAGARILDPILTEIARGYKQLDFAGGALFPTVPVGQRGGNIITFRKEDFQLYLTGRVPGANTKRVQYGYDGAAFSLEQHALEGQVPFEIMEEANSVPGIDMARVAVMKTQAIIALRLEKQQADLATTAATYASTNKVTLSGTAQWSDFTTGVSNPEGDVETGKEAIRKLTGRRGNTVVMGASVMAKLKQHPKILARTFPTGRDVPTPELLANVFGVDRVLSADSIYLDAAGVMQDIWGKFVVIAFTETSGLADMGLPSYGYTYQLRGYPIVETPYQDRNPKSWIYPVTDEVKPVIAGVDAGYLISAAIA
jgi:hypothetical protein